MCFLTPVRENFRSTTRRRIILLDGLMFPLPHWVQNSQVISIRLFGLDEVAFRLFRFFRRASRLSVRVNTRSRW
jgi:hypothetical protein